MPINSFLYPGAKVPPPPYEVANSCRFNRADSAYMSKTPSSGGSDTIATFSAWVKRAATEEYNGIFTSYSSTTNYFEINFESSGDCLEVRGEFSDSFVLRKITNRKFRDPSAWYHICVIIDTTDGTAEDRVKIYVNGVRETSFSTNTNPGSSQDLKLNNTGYEHRVGRDEWSSPNYFNGYMAEVHWIDGTAKAVTDFGEFDSDSPTIWKPKEYTGGSYGTNGFYLDFADSGNLGDDESGNTLDLAETNLAAADQATDTPTNNFCTMNPLILGSGTTLSEGNLQLTPSTNNTGFHSVATMGVATGKWYWEAKLVSGTKGAFGIIFDGSSGNVFEHQRNNNMPGNLANGWGYKPGNSGNVEASGSDITFSGDTATSSNVLGFAMDLDNDALYIHKDGTYMNSGNATSGASKTGAIDISGGAAGFVFPSYGDTDTAASPSAAYNFGGCPAFSISSGNSDANGYGNFEYAVPSGYYAICSKNLAEFG